MISSVSISQQPTPARRAGKLNAPETGPSPDRMTFTERLADIAGVGLLSATPIWGCTIATMQSFELALAGDAAANVLDTASMANIGSTVALGAGLIFGGPALAVGAVGLGLCGLVGAYGCHRALQDYRV